MSVSRRDLKDDEVLRFLRFSVTESAAATFTEQEYDTQLSIDRGLIWLIHWAEIQINVNIIEQPAASTTEAMYVQITRESQSAILSVSDADVIVYADKMKDRGAAVGTDAGPAMFLDKVPDKFDFSPPLPYAAQNIYVGIKSTAAAAKTIHGRIAYTLRRVSDKFFYRVAQALIS